MKKNFIFGLFALVTMLFTASCAEEQLVPNSAGNTATVSFKVSTPVLSTRAVGDGTTASKLYVAVYENQNGTLAGPLDVSLIDDGETVAFNNRVATVNLALAKNKEYSVIFWAETENNGEAMFDIDWTNRKLTLKQSLKANQEKYDAFWAQKTVNISENLSEEVKLTRPFSQLNIGTSDKAAAQAAGVVVEDTQVVIEGAYTTFNLQSGEATDEATVTYAMEAIADIKDENFPAADQSYLSLNYLLMNGDKSTVDVTFSYEDFEDEDAYTLNFNSVPVQRNYRTNIYGTLLTNSANYTVEILPGFPDDAAANIVNVTTQEEFNKALKSNEKNVVINLTPTEHNTAATRAAGDATVYTIEINGQNTYFGGENTESITINANGCTINFNYTNGDSQYIHCVNSNAKLIINDAHLTNSGKNNGPWNRHNICFFDAVELNNVTSDKAIALLNDSKLTGVSISDVHPDNSEAYGLWISARGQQVELDGCEIIAHSTKTTDRGITINDQYVGDALGKVTLIVKNTKFETQKKAAILVKSEAGADITLENVDLSGVKADGFNAVWVDADRNNIDKVSVDGGFVIVEGAAATNPFLVEGETVNVAKGVYSTLPKVANGVTIIAEEGTVFNGTSSVSGENVTIKNVIFKGDEKALAGNLNGTTFENCQFDATYGAQWCYAYGDVTFKNCVFGTETSKRGIHFDGGTGNVTFESCTFYAFNALGQANKKYSFNNCDIKVSSQALNKFNGVNMYGTTYEYTDCRFAPGTFTDCAGNNVVATYNNCSYTDARSIYSVVRFDKDPKTCTITFDGYKYVANGVGMQNEAYCLLNVEGLKWFANEVNTNKNAFNGKTVKLAANVDLAGIDWEPIGQTGKTTFNGVFDGDGYTISNLTVDSESETGAHYSSGLFGWVESHTAGHGHIKNVKIDGATITGHHNCGALVGYITQETALVENCHVTAATVTCTKANNDADGDKAGALIGNATVATPVKDCTAANSTVSAGRDAGQLIGAGKEANVTGCSATGVTVSANGTSTGKNVRNEVIGRLL